MPAGRNIFILPSSTICVRVLYRAWPNLAHLFPPGQKPGWLHNYANPALLDNLTPGLIAQFTATEDRAVEAKIRRNKHSAISLGQHELDTTFVLLVDEDYFAPTKST
jgi:hypothetical protein